jgi:glutaredoxin
VDHCHGCGNRCPAGAITYVGDDTGWTPPNGAPTEKDSGCSCGCETDSIKKIVVEYLYLDLETCDRCIGTDNVLDDVMMVLTPALQIAGFEVDYKKVEMKTAEIASQNKFLSSPTIRVNGKDICQSVAENSCGCCSDISGTDVSCRVFEYNGQSYEVPPKEMIAEAVLNAIFGQATDGCSCGKYELPENLKEFYEGKKNKSNFSCGGNC